MPATRTQTECTGKEPDRTLGATPSWGSAAATSVLTIIGVVILLMPVLFRTWREFNRKAA